MRRYNIINLLIKKYNFKSYLEIGYQNGICYDKIRVRRKNAVDPYPNIKKDHTLKVMTSDNFFKANIKKYDIIFIDGLHTYEQVKKDFENSLDALSSKGIIVFHDMSPEDTEYNGKIIPGEVRSKSFNEGGKWNGDCYKLAIDMYNGDYDYYYETVDSDQGCMILYPYKKREINKDNLEKTYTVLSEKRKEILNLLSKEEFEDKMKEINE